MGGSQTSRSCSCSPTPSSRITPTHPASSSPMEAPTDRLPVEIWQDILLSAIEPDGSSVFATTCTVSTFIHSLQLKRDPGDSYTKYMRRRATLRQVCRAWNQFLLSTNSWWIYIRGPNHPRNTLDLPSIPDQVPIIKRLSMTITAHDSVQPGLNWAFDLLHRAQAPLMSCDLTLSLPPPRLAQGPHDVLAAVGHKVALHSLRISSNIVQCASISFAQLSAHFKDLVSLSLHELSMCCPEELTLPRLELLDIYNYFGCHLPTQGWNLPRLRHFYIGTISTCCAVHRFLRRYASQLESILLKDYICSGLPHDFWDSFTALQLLGMSYNALTDRQWSGWATTPSRAHPFRYLLCCVYDGFDRKIDSIRSNWTYHEEVAFMMEKAIPGEYYLVEDIKKKGWKKRMTKINGLFPWLSLPPLTCK